MLSIRTKSSLNKDLYVLGFSLIKKGCGHFNFHELSDKGLWIVDWGLGMQDSGSGIRDYGLEIRD